MDLHIIAHEELIYNNPWMTCGISVTLGWHFGLWSTCGIRLIKDHTKVKFNYDIFLL